MGENELPDTGRVAIMWILSVFAVGVLILGLVVIFKALNDMFTGNENYLKTRVAINPELIEKHERRRSSLMTGRPSIDMGDDPGLAKDISMEDGIEPSSNIEMLPVYADKLGGNDTGSEPDDSDSSDGEFLELSSPTNKMRISQEDVSKDNQAASDEQEIEEDETPGIEEYERESKQSFDLMEGPHAEMLKQETEQELGLPTIGLDEDESTYII